ncbi:hypothetical protein C2S52_012656 [Perilla frutescens var. hirtella]|nr:hypothetical protein C2S52_012656 [Perilla frutescens var. hirtella]
MDPDEVVRLVEELQLSHEASASTIHVAISGLSRTYQDVKRILVGKIFSMRVVNRETLKTQVPRILQLCRHVDIEIVGDNLFVVVFGSQEDRRHTLADGPWHFFSSLIAFKAPEGFQNPADIRFDKFSVWVQLHNLLLACMNPSAIRKIEEQVGTIEEIDVGKGENYIGQFTHVRVSRHLERPYNTVSMWMRLFLVKEDWFCFYMRSYRTTVMHVVESAMC